MSWVCVALLFAKWEVSNCAKLRFEAELAYICIPVYICKDTQGYNHQVGTLYRYNR